MYSEFIVYSDINLVENVEKVFVVLSMLARTIRMSIDIDKGNKCVYLQKWVLPLIIYNQ